MMFCCPQLFAKSTPTALGPMSEMEVRKIVTPSLDQVLVGEVPVEPWVPTTFLEFLKVERNDENFFFFEEIEAFKALQDNPKKVPSKELLLLPEDVRKDPKLYAMSIIDTFVKEAAPKEVNISHDQRKSVLDKFNESIESQSIGSDMFEEAQAEVKKLMRLDAWPRFYRKVMNENISQEDSNYRLKEAGFIGVMTLLALALMLGLYAPRWYIFILIVPIYAFYEDLVTYKLSFCMRNAMKGLRDRFGAVNEKAPISCPVIQMKHRKRIKVVFAIVSVFALLTTGFFFALTYIIEAGVGKTLYG